MLFTQLEQTFATHSTRLVKFYVFMHVGTQAHVNSHAEARGQPQILFLRS